ncbi:hypothetical protein CKA32_001525 [Geitlerinema sp. FC II]|nr:hypothetical protein CKA32_001525 [Geitlerinema sp. FC II]
MYATGEAPVANSSDNARKKLGILYPVRDRFYAICDESSR